jgi:hypothetical protein
MDRRTARPSPTVLIVVSFAPRSLLPRSRGPGRHARYGRAVDRKLLLEPVVCVAVRLARTRHRLRARPLAPFSRANSNRKHASASGDGRNDRGIEDVLRRLGLARVCSGRIGCAGAAQRLNVDPLPFRPQFGNDECGDLQASLDGPCRDRTDDLGIERRLKRPRPSLALPSPRLLSSATRVNRYRRFCAPPPPRRARERRGPLRRVSAARLRLPDSVVGRPRVNTKSECRAPPHPPEGRDDLGSSTGPGPPVFGLSRWITLPHRCPHRLNLVCLQDASGRGGRVRVTC